MAEPRTETITDCDVDLYADFDNRFKSDGARFGVERRAVERLPIIDVSPFVRGGSPDEQRRVGREIRDACIDIGFFYISGHGIEPADLDELTAWAHRFFELPIEEKSKLHKSFSPRKLGYMQIGGTNPEANADRAPDLKENFNMCRELFPDEPDTGSFFTGDSQWPAQDVLPGFEAFMKPQIAKRARLAQGLARAFALSLDLEETFFDASHLCHGGILLLNYYPTLDPGAIDRTQWSNSPHSDYGSFTLLSQDDVGGLQVRNADGVWIDVPPVPGTFVVNIAELFAVWTNDLYAPSLHRAANVSARARVSAAYFVIAKSDTMVECVDSCRGPDNPPRYAPMLAGEHVRTLVEQSMRTGRPGVSARTAERFRRVGD